MLADGEYVDGSWLLSIHIDDLNIDREIRVYGEWSINELITQLIDGLTCPIPKSLNPNEISLRSNSVRSSWGDYGLWWPARSKWLLKTKSSLNQYGLQADAKLRFLSIYGNLNIQLPDLQIREFVDVNFAEPVFRVTLSICRYLNIRHPEELSLAHLIHQNDLKHSRFIPGYVDKRYHTLSNTGKRSTFQRSATINTTHSQYKTLRKESLFQTNEGTHTNGNDKQDETKSEEQSIKSSTLSRHSIHLFGPPKIRDKRTHLHRYSRPDSGNFNKVPFSPIAFDLRILDDSTLAFSPIMNVDDALQKGLIVRPNNYIQRIRLNTIWLDSSKSLLEQGIKMSGYSTNHQLSSPSVNRPNSPISSQNDEYTIPTLMLRYKYGIYYDLNIKYDLIRINQLYEQAKWSIISEINEVTNEEACLFAALQSQVELATEEETLMNDENLLNDNNNEEEQKGINGTIYTNDTQQLVNCPLDKSILDHCKTNVKKFKSTFIKHNRDISPLGGYLYHTGRYSMKSSSPSPSRPLSTIELDHEIDLMLDELSMNCLENTDSNLLTDGIKIQHCSRPKERLSRPLSLLNDTNHHHQSDIDSLMNNDQYDNHSNSLPELNTYVKICKPRKFGLKVFHRYYISVKGTELFVYKNKDDYLSNSDSAEVIYLPGCEIQSDLCISSEKFNLRLFVPVSRTNLPLSAAFAPCQSNGLQLDDEDPTVGSKLKRRASLLSLTSLSHLSNVLGISSSSSSNNGAQNGPINISGIGALTGSSATMTGLINELCLRFSNLTDYIDWLTIFRITTSIHLILPSNLSTDITDLSSISIKTKKSSKKSRSIIITSLLNRTIFNNERKAITNLIQLLSPNSLKLDQPDKVINLTRLHHHLDKRLIHMLPLRLSYMKNSYHKTIDYRWDHFKDDTLMKHSGTLPNHDKPPIYSSHMNQFIQTRNHFIQHISSIYTQINNLSSIQSKLKYINVWEQLHFHGIASFPARIEVTVPLNTLINGENDNNNGNSNGNGQTNWIPGMNRSSTMNNNHITISISRKIESIGIGSTRIYRCDLTNGEILASWRMSSIQSWHINWELSELVLNIAIQSNTMNTTTTNTTTGRVIIRPIDVSVRMIAEFLGGYTFLNLRSPEKNQCLAEDIFYKLTTGMSQPFV